MALDLATAEWLMQCLCRDCRRSKRGPCRILVYAAILPEDNDKYPRELKNTEIGLVCSAYEGPVETYLEYRDERQLEMFPKNFKQSYHQ